MTGDAFLAVPEYKDLFRDDIVRNKNGDIVSSRVRLNMDNVSIEDIAEQIDALDDQREVSAAQPINQGQAEYKFFTYDAVYNIWEFYASSVEELILTTILGVISLTGAALLFVNHWTASFFVLPMISVLYVDLLGVMHVICGASVTAICNCMCISL
jgi:hypothetical protein